MTAVRSSDTGGIRSVVLDGPSSPDRASWFNKPADFVDVLQRLSAACAAQPACNAAFPEVERTFWRTVAERDREPKAQPITLPNGTQTTLTVDGSVMATAMTAAFERGLQRAVPMAIHAAAVGDQRVMTALTRVLTAPPEDATGPNINWGLHYTLQCFEEAPLNTVALKQQVRSAYSAVLTDRGVFADPSICEGFHGFRARPQEAVLVESEIPTLIFTGEFDYQTHRSNGPRVARALKNSQLVEIPGAGHVQSLRHECTRTMTRDFYNERRRPVDTSCLKSMPPLQFVTDVKAISQ